MKLNVKRELAAKTLKVGISKILFDVNRLEEIKEAITKQDMKDLQSSGAIAIKGKKGQRRHIKRKTRRRKGSIKKNVIDKKRQYIILTRNLRRYIYKLRIDKKISEEFYQKLRKEIRARSFRDKHQLNERIAAIKNA